MNRKNINYQEEDIKIAMFSKALAHPVRIAILKYLASLDACYFGEIHNELPIAKATVSQHLSELKNAGLIQGSIEPPKVLYCIHKKNWNLAKKTYEKFFAQCCKKMKCC